MLTAGCSRLEPVAEQELAALLASDSGVSGPNAEAASVVEEHDFGPVIAHGQSLRHEFVLKNPSARPVRLLKATALTPCCSSVGSLPELVPPHGEATVPVLFKPGTHAGRKTVRFLLETDSPARPAYTFTLLATVFPEFEVTHLDQTNFSQPVGRPGRQRLRVTCRRLGDEGRNAPTAIEAIAPLIAAFVGPATETSQPGGPTEWTRDVEVTTPAEPDPGMRGGEIVLRWDGELSQRYRLNWRVRPCLEVTPPGLLVRAAEGRVMQTVQVRSDEAPFRVLEVSGECLAAPVEPPSAEPAPRQLVRLVIDPTKATESAVSEVRIVTDHPQQPSVTLSVVITPAGKAVGE
jgi:hypothetical protein